MGYTGTETDDLQKLKEALSFLTGMFSSVDGLLTAFGLQDLPNAQRYGILFGCMVFTGTVIAVLSLLSLGGTFERLKEQEFGSQQKGQSNLSASDARLQRALLLEELLEGRERLMNNYSRKEPTTEVTKLTTMLLQVPPKPVEPTLVKDTEFVHTHTTQAVYQENYVKGYRTCQDRPGGSPMSGRPEARFEAYARAFAGCGSYTTPSYRRSYARLYEAVVCHSHKTDDKYAKLFQERPRDLVGSTVRLEALDVNRHAKDLFNLTNGQPVNEHGSYDPNEVWGFQEQGPFETENQLKDSFVFNREDKEAAFAIINNITDRLVGVIILKYDDPKNLSIQIETPLMHPSRQGSIDEIEPCFLLMDRLFAFGYRRVQFSIDAQDAIKRKLATRLGFTLEGILYKHMIIKEASRDSNIYGMLNSDWKRGARIALYKMLYGAAALQNDQSNEKMEEEFEEQERILAAKKKIAEQEQQEEQQHKENDHSKANAKSSASSGKSDAKKNTSASKPLTAKA